MDEFSTAYPGEGSSSFRSHVRTGSFVSNISAQTAPPMGRSVQRLKTPILRHRISSASVQSNMSGTDRSDIIAPVPRRHHTLHAHETRHWLDTPPLSPASTRADSPLSNVTVSPRTLRMNHWSSLSSVLEQDRGTTVPSHMHPPRATNARKPAIESSMGRRWVRWMHKQNMKHWVIPCVILGVTWVKWCVGLGSYSGQGTPPMFGDYEAQRHWMELTVHLSIPEWYTYDLEYWGLDYPPLTAYVSWLCGIIGSWVDPAWFALDKSRGIESSASKLFMRSTVVAFDALVYIPAIIIFTLIWQRSRSTRTQHASFLTLLLQPALLLIDFGHFQYNSVMLGFTLLAVNFFAINRDLLGAFCFVLSLGFKQMALYYAPAIGSYLIAKCLYLGPIEGRQLFIQLALVTSTTFIMLFLPFLPPFTQLSAILDPITRIFPFARGLFEDKVANFWCATNVVFKWKLWVSTGSLVRMSTLLTAAGFLPSVVGLIYSGYKTRLTSQDAVSKDDSTKESASSPTPFLSLLPYALLASSMSFFLFSFQVHEKTILVPLLPLTLLLSGSPPDSTTFELGALVNNVAVFSMWPLLKRDGLGVQYVAVTLLWNRLIGYNPLRSWPQSFLHFVSLVVYAACLSLHFSEMIIPPPQRLPDIYPVLNVLISTPIFALTWLWSIKRGIEIGWALGGLGSGSPASRPPSRSATTTILEGPLGTGRSADRHLHNADGRSAMKDVALGRREFGLRTRSLGFARGERVNMLRTASVGPSG